jgi:hypothetical protein
LYVLVCITPILICIALGGSVAPAADPPLV